MIRRLEMIIIVALLFSACSDARETRNPPPSRVDTGTAELADAEPSRDAGATSTQDGSARDATPQPMPSTSGFAESESRWQVPAIGVPDGVFFLEGRDDERLSWETTDVDGDRYLDLLIRNDPATELPWEDAGQRFYRVYRGTASGFEQSFVEWFLPSAAEGTRNETFEVLADMTGDGRVDFVMPGSPWADASGDYFKVFVNDGARFAAAVTRWSVPSRSDDFGLGGFRVTEGDGWGAIDLDGDRLLDLVIMRPSKRATEPFSDAQGKFWQVYFSGATGFDESPTRWAVPVREDGSHFLRVRAPPHRIADFDGDGRADLMEAALGEGTNAPVFSDAEGPFWKLYRNDGDGFSPMERFSVPASREGYGAIERRANGDKYSTFDIDGDGRPDLVSTEQEGNAGYAWDLPDGSHYWKVYLNTGSSFLATDRQWRIPPGREYRGFYVPTRGHWATIDLNGDGRLDFAITSEDTFDASHDPVFSDTSGPFWRVYYGAR